MPCVRNLKTLKRLFELPRAFKTARGHIFNRRVRMGAGIWFASSATISGSEYLHKIQRLGHPHCVYGKSYGHFGARELNSSLVGCLYEQMPGGQVFTAAFTTCNTGSFSGRASKLLDYNINGHLANRNMHFDSMTEPQSRPVHFAYGQSSITLDGNSETNKLLANSKEELNDHNKTLRCAEFVDSTSEKLKNQQTCHSFEKACQYQSYGSDYYEEVKITDDAGEPLMPRSLLDLAVEDFMHKENEQGHLLWQRFKKAASMRGGFTCECVLATWVEEGNRALRPALIYSVLAFRSWKKHKRALELFDWILREKPFEMTEMDCALYMDLLCKIGSCKKSSKYFRKIPKPFQSSIATSALLAAYLEHEKEGNARRLLIQARSLGLTKQTFLFNQVLLFYKGKGRISEFADLLKEMEDLGVDANLSTYNIILDLKARKGDVSGMRNLWNYLEKEMNIKPDAASYALLAKGYLIAGMFDRAESAVKQIEARSHPRKQVVYRWLLKLYAQLKREDHLERVWDMLKNVSKSLVDDYSIMVESLGKAGEVNRAEEIFKEGLSTFGVKRLHQYHTLISVFLGHGMIEKAEALVEELTRNACNPGSATYHQLIELYVKSGDEKKAMETLRKAQDASKEFTGHKPWYASYLTILEMFGKKGDAKQAELIVKELKETGYSCSFKMYSALLKAYVKAKIMPHGFLDRMRADGAIPNSCIRNKLEKIMDNRRELYYVNGAKCYLY